MKVDDPRYEDECIPAANPCQYELNLAFDDLKSSFGAMFGEEKLLEFFAGIFRTMRTTLNVFLSRAIPDRTCDASGEQLSMFGPASIAIADVLGPERQTIVLLGEP